MTFRDILAKYRAISFSERDIVPQREHLPICQFSQKINIIIL